jgi:rubrerythrin
MSVSADHERDAGPIEDGIVVELARDDVARKRFLKMAGKSMGSGAAAAALGAFIAACGSSSSKSSTGSSGAAGAGASTGSGGSTAGDIKIVNYALTLEYLEANFYTQVGASGLFSSSPALPLLKEFGSEEQMHVTALTAAVQKLGGKPAAMVTGKFPLKSATEVALLAATVENLGAAAYLGQAGNIKNPEILAAALAIHTVEARHAATLNLLVHKSPTPEGAFGKPMSMSQVLKVVTPFIA